METRQVTLQAPDTNTTQNYTVSGFGTPQAAIILYCSGGNQSWSNNANLGMGFWDGTNSTCVTGGWEDNGSPGSFDSQHATSDSEVLWVIWNGTSINHRKATVSGTTTDGITLSFTGTSPASVRPYVTVILLKGLNGVQCGFRVASKTVDATTQTTTTGMTPKLVITASRRSDTVDGSSSDFSVHWGFAAGTGATDQFVVGWRNKDTDPTDCNGQVKSGWCATSDLSTSGGMPAGFEMTTMTSGSFTTTTRGAVPGFSTHAYLALDFDESVAGWSSATPTTSTNWDPYAASFTPQWAFMFPTGFGALNTSYGGGQDGVETSGIYSVNSSSEEDGHYITMENGSTGAGTMFGQARYDDRLEINEVTATPSSSALVTGVTPTFDSSGIDYSNANFTEDFGTAHQVIGFFVQEATAGLVPIRRRRM